MRINGEEITEKHIQAFYNSDDGKDVRRLMDKPRTFALLGIISVILQAAFLFYPLEQIDGATHQMFIFEFFFYALLFFVVVLSFYSGYPIAWYRKQVERSFWGLLLFSVILVASLVKQSINLNDCPDGDQPVCDLSNPPTLNLARVYACNDQRYILIWRAALTTASFFFGVATMFYLAKLNSAIQKFDESKSSYEGNEKIIVVQMQDPDKAGRSDAQKTRSAPPLPPRNEETPGSTANGFYDSFYDDDDEEEDSNFTSKIF